MVFLAITTNGLNDLLRVAATIKASVWCGADTITEADYANHQHQNLSRFSYALGDRDESILADAVQTINEHHPGEVIWIEGASVAHPG